MEVEVAGLPVKDHAKNRECKASFKKRTFESVSYFGRKKATNFLARDFLNRSVLET